MSFFSKKWRIVLVAAAVVAAAGFTIEHFAGVNPIGAAVKTVAAPVQTGFSYIAGGVKNACTFVWDMRAYKADNEELTAENLRLKQINRDTASYREENERLQELLDLKESITDYSTVAARVISYSSNSAEEKIEINKGTVAGISVGNAVITPDGIVGQVTETGLNYSVVTTILDSSSAIGIRVSRTGGSGLVEGDNELAQNMQCKLSFVDRSTPIIVGDIVESSGSGDVYPAGFIVGSITSVSADSTGNLKYAVIDPAVDFGNLQEVLVVNGVISG